MASFWQWFGGQQPFSHFVLLETVVPNLIQHNVLRVEGILLSFCRLSWFVLFKNTFTTIFMQYFFTYINSSSSNVNENDCILSVASLTPL